MRKASLSFFACIILGSTWAQDYPFSDSIRNNTSLKIIQIQNSRDSTINKNNLDLLLSRKFPVKSKGDGRWVYYKKDANIKQIEKPEVSKAIPGYEFYQVRLTNFVGYHIYSSNCLILYNQGNSKIVFVVPMWYRDISKDFLTLFIGKKFTDSSALIKFTYELQDLMIVGSTGKFENTKYFPNKVTFDMTDRGRIVKEIWRHIEIEIDNNTIKGFTSTNPVMNDRIIIK